MIIKAIERAYKRANEKEWDKIYWAIDLHDTCFESNYMSGKYKLINDDVIKTLKLIQSCQESILIMWTSAHHEEWPSLWNFFNSNGIQFNYFNFNPEIGNTETGCFEEKFYFNILLDDKAGFDPEIDWKLIKNWLENERINFI